MIDSRTFHITMVKAREDFVLDLQASRGDDVGVSRKEVELLENFTDFLVGYADFVEMFHE